MYEKKNQNKMKLPFLAYNLHVNYAIHNLGVLINEGNQGFTFYEEESCRYLFINAFTVMQTICFVHF